MGTNALLRLGATPVTCVADVLEALAAGESNVDQLTGVTGLAPAAVSAALTALELDGRVSIGEGAYRSTISR